MKSFRAAEEKAAAQSLPVRGAWVEITTARPHTRTRARRSPCGERGLKYGVSEKQVEYASRSPCGERGLKCAERSPLIFSSSVAPRAGSVG